MAATSHLTIDDFERLPHEQAGNCELVDGELVPMSGTTPEHNGIRDFLIATMYSFVRDGHLGVVFAEQEYDFNGNAHGPDVSFFGPAKKALVNSRKRVQRFVPDLAIEVVSEYDTYSSLKRKKERYLAYGTQEVWIVSPEDRQVEIYSPREVRILRGDEELSTGLIPSFRIKVSHLFEMAWE